MNKTLLNLVKPQDSHLDNTPFSFIQKLKLKLNYKNLNNETVEVLNDSEYLERVKMLWEDSAQKILES